MVGGDDRRRGFRVDRVSERLHFVHTEHVNWVVYAGPDGVTLIDSGYVGQRDLLVASLDAIGHRPEEVVAVLITHGHADHLGGAAWLAEQFGTAGARPRRGGGEREPSGHAAGRTRRRGAQRVAPGRRSPGPPPSCRCSIDAPTSACRA